MLQPCTFCVVIHTPHNLWCARSMGMPAESPLPEMSGGCGLSKCENGFCACDMRAYDKEFEARVRARVELYNSQLKQRDSFVRRAATELVDRATGIALGAVNYDNPCLSACTPSTGPSINVCTLDPAGQLPTTEMLDGAPAWPIEQVVTELSQAAQIRLPELEWQQLTGDKVFRLQVPGTESSSSTGGARSIADAFQSGPETDSYVRMPVGMTGKLVRAEQRPLSGFSCGGAHDAGSSSLDIREPTDDLTITDSELGTCIGLCDTGHCYDGCKCSLRLKRKRPVVHAPAADIADGTFKRPALFKKGDAVEFASPERRIQVRTFGTVESVQHVGAQPYYTVTSTKGTIYSFHPLLNVHTATGMLAVQPPGAHKIC